MKTVKITDPKDLRVGDMWNGEPVTEFDIKFFLALKKLLRKFWIKGIRVQREDEPVEPLRIRFGNETGWNLDPNDGNRSHDEVKGKTFIEETPELLAALVAYRSKVQVETRAEVPAAQVHKELPAVWEQIMAVKVLDPDGWRIDGALWKTPITRDEFVSRMNKSTCRHLFAQPNVEPDASESGGIAWESITANGQRDWRILAKKRGVEAKRLEGVIAAKNEELAYLRKEISAVKLLASQVGKGNTKEPAKNGSGLKPPTKPWKPTRRRKDCERAIVLSDHNRAILRLDVPVRAVLEVG